MASRGRITDWPVRSSTAAPSRRRPLTLAPAMSWVIGVSSAALLAVYSLWYSATEPEMDFQVYRMGAQHIFGPGLYSSQIEVLGRHLSFTYPPFAAFLFWPISHLSSLGDRLFGTPCNLIAARVADRVSIAAARSRHPSTRIARPLWCSSSRRIALVPGTKRPGPRPNQHRVDSDDHGGSDDWGSRGAAIPCRRACWWAWRRQSS